MATSKKLKSESEVKSYDVISPLKLEDGIVSSGVIDMNESEAEELIKSGVLVERRVK